MALTDSLLRASTGGRRLSVLVAFVLIAVPTGVSAGRGVGGVRRNGRARCQAAGAGCRRGRGSIRILGADGPAAVGSGDDSRLARRDVGSVDQLLLTIDNDGLASLEVGAVGEHGAGADREVDVDGHDVCGERLTRLLAVAAPGVATLLFVTISLLVAGGRCRA